MTLIDGDRIITAQLYDDEHEEFTEQKMSIIDYINAYTIEGITTADNVLDKIRAEIEELADADGYGDYQLGFSFGLMMAMEIIDKYKEESEEISDTNLKMRQEIFKAESDHKCYTCKHYTSGEHDGSCGSYICKGYSNWESEVQ